MSSILEIFDVQLFAATVRMTTPILLAALGGMMCSHSGSMNIALEGLMLLGSFAAVAGSYYTGSWLLGLLFAVALGVVLSLFFAIAVLRFRANEMVIGIAINMFSTGITTFLMRYLWGVKGSFIDPKIIPLPNLRIPVIDKIPILGPIVSGHNPVIYISWAIVLILQYLLYCTPFGLQFRSVGENVQAAESLGVKTKRMKYVAIIVSGGLSGLAGAQLSLGLVTLFLINMSAGRGFVAVVANILGRNTPFGILGASLLFGLAEGLTMRLQGIGVPSQFVLMLPYLTTIVAMMAMHERKKRLALPLQAHKGRSAPRASGT